MEKWICRKAELEELPILLWLIATMLERGEDGGREGEGETISQSVTTATQLARELQLKVSLSYHSNLPLHSYPNSYRATAKGISLVS